MGTLVLAGATSGSTTLTPVDAVTTVLTLPSATATLATLGANTFTGNQSITGTLGVTGSISTTSGDITLSGASAKLDLTGATAAQIRFTNAVDNCIDMRVPAGASKRVNIFMRSTDGASATKDWYVGSNWFGTTGAFEIGNGSSNFLNISTAGAVTMPAQPAFQAQSPGEANVTGNGTDATLAFTTEIFDQGGNFASSTFTAPVTGKYALFASVTAAQLATNHTEQNFQIVTSNRTYRGEYFQYASSCPFITYAYKIAVLADMDAGDTAAVHLIVTGGSLVVDIEANTYSRFSGYLAC